MGRERPRLLAILGTVAFAAVSGAAEAKEAGAEQRPPWFINGPVKVTSYDGVSDDLLTAGLGAAGIASATPPAVADPAHPTAAELRRLAIWSNYRALVDTVPGGGFGLFYGPGVGEGPEKIAGKEYLAYWRAGDLPNGLPQNVGLLVQIPASFDPAHACLIAAPSSGSRGVYGAIATAGEWGLKKGCAVAYTDKGTGTGAHDLHGDRVGLIDGLRTTAPIAGDRSSFTAPIGEEERVRYDKRMPDRYAFKHAHSEVNPERDWGVDVLQALRFALWALNKEYGAKGKELTWANTLVIASSVSNGGGASLRAAELAPQGMIDGVAVSEPNVNPVYDKGVVIRQGSGAPLAAHSRPLIDYTTLVNVYQGCANYGRSYGAPPLSTLLAANQAFAAGTCASLAQLGLVKGKSTAEQAAEAQRAINRYGILPEQNELQPAYWLFGTPQGISVTYANAYSRASVADDLCGYSFAATSPASPYQPVALPEAADAVLFGLANGIPPTAGIQLVNDLASGGPTRNDVSVSAGLNRQDQNLPGALCLRAMAADRNLAESAPLGADPKPLLDHLRESLQQIRATGKLRGIPTVIVQGRSDAILPPNHTSRPYYALSRRADGKASQIRYYEVLNAHHLDVFNGFPDFSARLVLLHVYFFQALDLMYDHLTKGTPLPPSQVVRTTPRGSAATPLSAANVPPVAATPAAGDLITFDGRTLGIPE